MRGGGGGGPTRMIQRLISRENNADQIVTKRLQIEIAMPVTIWAPSEI